MRDVYRVVLGGGSGQFLIIIVQRLGDIGMPGPFAILIVPGETLLNQRIGFMVSGGPEGVVEHPTPDSKSAESSAAVTSVATLRWNMISLL